MRQITLTTVNDCYSETFPISNAMFDSVQFLPSGMERIFAIVILLNARYHFPDGEYTGVYLVQNEYSDLEKSFNLSGNSVLFETMFTFVIENGAVFHSETQALEADGVAVI